MRHSEGKKDAKPIELREVVLVHKDKEDPIYLVMLDREAWHETREVDLDGGMSGTETVDDPGFVTDHSYWLVSFISNGITDFREAPEMFRLWDEDASLKDCY